MPANTDVLIIGAGPAGLAAAHLLSRRRRQVTVIGGHDYAFDVQGAADEPEAVASFRRDLQSMGDGPDACGRPAWGAAYGPIMAAGGALRLEETLEMARWDPVARVWEVSVRHGESVSTLVAEHLVSSVPISDLAGALKPAPISRLHARRLRYADRVSVKFTVRDAQTAAAVPDLRFDYACFEGDEVWAADDQSMIARARHEAGMTGSIPRLDIIEALVVREVRACPLDDDDEHEHNLKMIRLDLERSYPTLQLAGRDGLHRPHEQAAELLTGLLAAENILAGKRQFDVWQVGQHGEYPEDYQPHWTLQPATAWSVA